MKVVENSPQNARNGTIFKNFLGGPCPQTPLAKARSFAARDMPLRGMYIQNHRNFKVGPPPPEKSCIRPCTIRIICITTFIFINLIIDYNSRLILTVMSVMPNANIQLS